MGMGRMAVLAAYNCWPGGIRAMPAEREREREHQFQLKVNFKTLCGGGCICTTVVKQAIISVKLGV